MHSGGLHSHQPPGTSLRSSHRRPQAPHPKRKFLAASFKVPITYIPGPFKATLRDGVFLDLWRGDAKAPEISLRIQPAERTYLLLAFHAVSERP
jgi:hypothetical protein